MRGKLFGGRLFLGRLFGRLIETVAQAVAIRSLGELLAKGKVQKVESRVRKHEPATQPREWNIETRDLARLVEIQAPGRTIENMSSGRVINALPNGAALTASGAPQVLTQRARVISKSSEGTPSLLAVVREQETEGKQR